MTALQQSSSPLRRGATQANPMSDRKPPSQPAVADVVGGYIVGAVAVVLLMLGGIWIAYGSSHVDYISPTRAIDKAVSTPID
jgi:hypothetical protein